MVEVSSSLLTIQRRLGQVVGSVPRHVPFFAFFLFSTKNTNEHILCVKGEQILLP